MDESDYVVSGVYTSRGAAALVCERLVARGLPSTQTDVVDDIKTAGNTTRVADDALKDILFNGAIGAAVGTGFGALAEMALVAANISFFVASPVIAPLVMMGWGAALGGVVGALVGVNRSESRTEGKFSGRVMDAIPSGHVVLIAHTRSAEETALVRDVIGNSASALLRN